MVECGDAFKRLNFKAPQHPRPLIKHSKQIQQNGNGARSDYMKSGDYHPGIARYGSQPL